MGDKNHNPNPIQKINNFYHALGALTTDDDPNESLVLSAKTKEIIVSEQEWTAYQTYLQTKPNRPSKDLRLGKLCFYHDWNSTHNLQRCAVT